MFEIETIVPGVRALKIPDSGGFSNIFLVGPDRDLMLVDTYHADAAGEVVSTLEQAGIGSGDVRKIVVTHGHDDHFGGVATLKKWTGAATFSHPFTAALCRIENLINEGDIIPHAGFSFNVIHAPGHNGGEIVLFEKSRRWAFVGDMIQGGMDVNRNWLGLFTDIGAQKKSLRRVQAFDPSWLFKGHRHARTGADIPKDFQSANNRIDRICEFVRKSLEAGAPRDAALLAQNAFREILSMEPPSPVPDYAIGTIQAAMEYLG
jgi:glyoxylase-like metal-dependent hydrolase (beta-lactamase superfamily II)